MNNINFSQLNQDQRQKLLQHLEDFKSNPYLDEEASINRLERISNEISSGGSISDEVDTHMLGVYISNTYSGDNGPAWFQYIHSLGLPQNLW